jgi:phospholipid/cholesterol/gamma-HCH transport system ATP-binding protein
LLDLLKGPFIAAEEFFTLAGRALGNIFRRPHYGSDIILQMDSIGVGSLLLVVLVGFFAGVVMALQMAHALRTYGQVSKTGTLVAITLARELGPVFGALMMAGRNATGIASELGSMKVTEQIDAMRALGTDPIQKLVTPRVVATGVMLPPLTVIADFVGLIVSGLDLGAVLELGVARVGVERRRSAGPSEAAGVWRDGLADRLLLRPAQQRGDAGRGPRHHAGDGGLGGVHSDSRRDDHEDLRGPGGVMAESTGAPILRFENVSVAFDGTPALIDVSFQAVAGESRVILGAAGSGKTVLLKIALGLTRPDSGRVFAFEREIGSMPERELMDVRSGIGMLFQESALFDSLTIEENVAYPLENQKAIHCPPAEVRPRVVEALEFVELGDTLEKFPSELSGGMRRRVGIARAVVTAPPLVLYDSPTAGLDPITAHTIMTLLIKQRDLARTTTLIVTHRYQDGLLVANFRYNSELGRLELARNGAGRGARTTFMVLREGRLVFEGGQEKVEASPDPYVSKFVKRRV